MKAKEYDVLEMAVEHGIAFGWTHAHKHVDNPSPDTIKDQIRNDVMNMICEWFTFEAAEVEGS